MNTTFAYIVRSSSCMVSNFFRFFSYSKLFFCHERVITRSCSNSLLNMWFTHMWRDHLFGGGAVPTLFQIMHSPQFLFAKFRKKYARNIRVYMVFIWWEDKTKKGGHALQKPDVWSLWSCDSSSFCTVLGENGALMLSPTNCETLAVIRFLHAQKSTANCATVWCGQYTEGQTDVEVEDHSGRRPWWCQNWCKVCGSHFTVSELFGQWLQTMVYDTGIQMLVHWYDNASITEK